MRRNRLAVGIAAITTSMFLVTTGFAVPVVFSLQKGVDEGFAFSAMHMGDSSILEVDGSDFYRAGSPVRWIEEFQSLDADLTGSVLTFSDNSLSNPLLVDGETDNLLITGGVLDFSAAPGDLFGTINYAFGLETGSYYFYNDEFMPGGPANIDNTVISEANGGGTVRLWGNNWDNKAQSNSLERIDHIAAGGVARGIDLGGTIVIASGPISVPEAGSTVLFMSLAMLGLGVARKRY